MPRQRVAYRWPTHREWDRRDAVDQLEEANRRLDRALDNNERMRSDVVERDILHVRRIVGDVRTLLIEARDGEPDDLGRALEFLKDALAGELPVSAVQALIDRYTE